MKETYARQYAELYGRHWWWRSRERFLRAVLRTLPLDADLGPVLDVGCGDGLFFPVLRAWGTPEGVEADGTVVTAEGRARGRIHVGPFDETFRPDRRYPLITALDVLEHASDEGAFLRRAHDLLSDAGLLVLTVPAFPWLWTHHDDINLHRTRYTRATLRTVARSAGLDVLRLHYFFGWTVPAKPLVRMKEALLGAGADTVRTPPPLINRLLEGVSNLEHHAALRGVLPAGSSLLAVLRRSGTP
ncbi:MAG: class I SAM-dependent methyltransferase [Pseudomonadota bacterium]